MAFKFPLAGRLVLSYVLLTTVVSGLFTLGLLATIHRIEDDLIAAELKRDFSRILDDYRHGRELRLDEGTAFFTTGSRIPPYLESVPAGYSEVVLEEKAYYVFHQQENRAGYFLVKDQTSFEQEEQLLEKVVVTGFVLSVIVSFLLGRLSVRRIIAPVRRLTREVTSQQGLAKEAAGISEGYAADEVGALALAFDATFSKLSQALQREALFTADVSHEFRTPLMVIASSCEVLQARNGLDPYVMQRVAAIQAATREMKELVEAFLALARGKETTSEMATLARVVEAEKESWRELAAARGNTLTIHDETLPTGQVREFPAVLLRTVIGNLVRNAIHHTRDGEILLCLQPGGFILSDTGSGIPPEETDKVFQPFFRGVGSEYEGLGLGLSLVRRICEREHWTVSLENNRTTGSGFRIDFG